MIKVGIFKAFLTALEGARIIGTTLYRTLRLANGNPANSIEITAKHTVKVEADNDERT
jgi:hypothetical protein